MQQFWFAIGQFIDRTFDWFLTPFGWVPVTLIVVAMTLGAIYWLMLQEKFSRRSRERGEHI